MSAPAESTAGEALPVEVRALRKMYGAVRAVDGVDLTVHSGDIYGYLGPNGAGKTTTLRMVLGLIRRDAGSVRLFGRDPQGGPAALAGVAGFVESPTFYPYLSGRESLELLGTLDGGSDRRWIDECLDRVGLLERAHDRVGGYSLGMRQRLGIAASLMRRPALLVLDEPANGLDPGGIRDLRRLVSELPSQGVTVLYSSHLLAEVEDVCNRVAILSDGRVAFEGALDELRASFGEATRIVTADADRTAEIAAAVGISGAKVEGDAVWLEASTPEVDALTLALGSAGIPIRSLTQERRSLEDLFFQLTEDTA